MKRIKYFAPIAVLALCVASVSWAGGASCTHDESSASTTTTTGGTCTMKSGSASAAAAAQICSVKPNQVIYSFSVPTAHCGDCVSTIQSTAMDAKGIYCVGFDLSTHTAYIIADKNMSKKDVSKLITEAGFKNKYTGEGTKVETAFTQAVATGGKNVSCCVRNNKDKA